MHFGRKNNPSIGVIARNHEIDERRDLAAGQRFYAPCNRLFATCAKPARD
jgi:hypothetical protein